MWLNNKTFFILDIEAFFNELVFCTTKMINFSLMLLLLLIIKGHSLQFFPNGFRLTRHSNIHLVYPADELQLSCLLWLFEFFQNSENKHYKKNGFSLLAEKPFYQLYLIALFSYHNSMCYYFFLCLYLDKVDAWRLVLHIHLVMQWSHGWAF